MSNSHQAKLMRRATIASISVAISLIILKFIAYMMSDSVALLSSLVDSVLDSFASILNFIAVKHALTPADDDHRFGHGKAEPLAGLGQAAFIAGSSLFLIFESLSRFTHPSPIEHGTIGIVVMLISLVMTIALVLYQQYVIRQTKSVAIAADSLHYITDIALNISVIIALILVTYLGWSLADPIIALGIAIYIIFSAWEILKQSLDQLMDKELPDDDREKISQIVLSHPEVRGFHELRTRVSGIQTFIQLHLELDGDLPLRQAHDIGDAVEKSLLDAFENADVIIHQDPLMSS